MSDEQAKVLRRYAARFYYSNADIPGWLLDWVEDGNAAHLAGDFYRDEVRDLYNLLAHVHSEAVYSSSPSDPPGRR